MVTSENLDQFLLILVRITAFIYVAPFFNLKYVPQKVKVGFSFFFALIIFEIIPETNIEYQTTVEYACLLISEAMVGVIIGFFTNISYYIITFAGTIMDTEIGFSMVTQLDPTTNLQTTITSNFYSYLVMLMMLITNMHYYIIKAMVDAFHVIPLGGAEFKANMYLVMLSFMKDYFIIGFRIVLPVFACMMITNAILAILAKIAPQMNMFVIGMQLKVFVGLIVLYFIVELIPTVSNFIFEEMFDMMKSAIKVLS